MTADWIRPDWPAPANVHAVITTRVGGVSRGPYGVPPRGGGGMNLGFGSGDDPADITANRAVLRTVLPSDPRWLSQVHGAVVIDAARVDAGAEADASFTNAPNIVCVVSVADCMPVLLTDTLGRAVGVAHAGWRGLAAGVIQATAKSIRASLVDADSELLAYLGPAIGPDHFEVGAEVLEAMQSQLPEARNAFNQRPGGKYLADLFALGRQALEQAGITRIYGGYDCTFSDPARFYSFRRDRKTGRHAALIWRV
ncbi:MAG TPA: peptidoglycan editing factor PgeF [Burkholderiaceae bacterium]|nr:peptidoglycan editing factor PgeF [Burkholderiaceae bacterium]